MKATLPQLATYIVRDGWRVVAQDELGIRTYQSQDGTFRCWVTPEQHEAVWKLIDAMPIKKESN